MSLVPESYLEQYRSGLERVHSETLVSLCRFADSQRVSIQSTSGSDRLVGSSDLHALLSRIESLMSSLTVIVGNSSSSSVPEAAVSPLCIKSLAEVVRSVVSEVDSSSSPSVPVVAASGPSPEIVTSSAVPSSSKPGSDRRPAVTDTLMSGAGSPSWKHHLGFADLSDTGTWGPLDNTKKLQTPYSLPLNP